MLIKKTILPVIMMVFLSGISVAYADDECTAAKPRPVINKDTQNKLSSYDLEWEHSSGHQTGLTETLVLSSGVVVKVVSGGCESYGISYEIIIDGQLARIPEDVTDIETKFDFLKVWIEKAARAGDELQQLGLSVDALHKVVSVKAPFNYLNIYHFPDQVSIALSDDLGYETNRLEFYQLKNKKVKITFGKSFAL